MKYIDNLCMEDYILYYELYCIISYVEFDFGTLKNWIQNINENMLCIYDRIKMINKIELLVITMTIHLCMKYLEIWS